MKAINTLLFVCLLQGFAISQVNYTAFTVNDGLPSNHIYQCLEDNNGFLWIATDAGVARFDGKFFQVFTIEHGLPDNEVLQLAKEKDGTIWVNCFKQGPAYFDAVKNRFISAGEDSSLRVSGTSNMHLFALPEGGVQYHNENGANVFRNRKPDKKFQNLRFSRFFIKDNEDGSTLWWKAYKGERCVIVHSKGKVDIDSVILGPRKQGLYYSFIDNNRLIVYRRNGNTCIFYSNFQTAPLRFNTDTIVVPEPFFHLSFARTKFFCLTTSGKLYVFNSTTCTPETVISGDYLPNAFYDDSKGNVWISTIDKGLIVYRKKQVVSIELPGLNRTNFISLAKKGTSLLAGNYYGEVVEIKHKNVTTHTVIKKIPSRQRKIIPSGNNVYTISEDGTSLNYVPDTTFNGGKTGILYNDSILLIGSVGAINIMNIKTNRVIKNLRYRRVTSMAKTINGLVYLGSTDGLHTYDFFNDRFTSLVSISPLLADRIAALCTTPDDIVWIATSGKGMVAMKDRKVLANITMQNGIINNACRSLSAGAPGQVWLGTSQGISIVHYSLNNGKLNFATQNLTVNDGLVSNEINELLYSNDTVYIATGNGLSLVPATFTLPKFEIPVKLIRMNINQQDTGISTKYVLSYRQQNILMQFAAIELNGHFKYLQYSTDDNQNWIDIAGRTLTLQLNSGVHVIKVRAVDVNGNISNKILSVEFDIATPFWKAFWFWLVIAVAAQLLIVYAINRWQKKRKEMKLAKEIAVVHTASLEQQAFTSLMNPHFMFNALNSIQHYINVQDRQKANRYLSDFASLIRKNFEAAQQSFISLDQELENIKIYLRLEQMRFTDKFKYKIEIADDIDVESWMIPTMVLQPLLENAVLHGIMPSSVTGELSIEIKEAGNHLEIVITDNGIGIKNSNALKQNNRHKSHGMELIKKRINALSHFSGNPITMVMAPAFDSSQNPGNRITITVPAVLHSAWLRVQRKNTVSSN